MIDNNILQGADTSKAESMHFHSIIDCLTLLGIPIEPSNTIFKDAVSTFANSLLGNGNEAYRDYFSTPPHEHVFRIVKKSRESRIVKPKNHRR